MKIVEQVPEYIRSLIPYEPGKPIEEVERDYGIANSVNKRWIRSACSAILVAASPLSASST